MYNKTFSLAMWRIDNPAHEHEAVCAVLVDQKEEGMIHGEADLRREGHEAHLGQSSSFCPLLIHSDCSLVLHLQRERRRLSLVEIIAFVICTREWTTHILLLWLFSFRIRISWSHDIMVELIALTQFIATFSEVIPLKSPRGWNKSVRPISFKFSITS